MMASVAVGLYGAQEALKGKRSLLILSGYCNLF